ncbi:MAG TPA: ABC transporter permease [Candidatus Dormibacteraeota bacterium]|jgi:ABC-2 type transport system permease protein
MTPLARIGRLFEHETRLILTNPRLLLAIVGLPLVLTLLANLTFSPPAAAPDRLGVLDQDSTTLSKKVASQLLTWKGLTTLSLAGSENPQGYVNAHPDVVVVLLPKGLDASVLQGSAVALQTFVNRRGSRQDALATTAISNAGVEISAVATAVAAARLRAARARTNEDTAAATAERDALTKFQIGRTRNQTTLVGPAQPATTLTPQAQFATVTAMSVLELVALLLAFSMASEHENSRLRRLLWTRLSLPEVIVARALASWVWIMLALAIVLVVSIADGMSAGPNVPLLIVISMAVGLALSGYTVLVMGVGYAARQIFQAVGAILTVGVGAVGGSLLPSTSLPGFLANIGRITPNVWASQAYRAVLVQGDTGSALWTPLGVLVLMALVEALLGALLIRRALRQV